MTDAVRPTQGGPYTVGVGLMVAALLCTPVAAQTRYKDAEWATAWPRSH